MDADGSNAVQLTDNEFYDRHPKWSPDGAEIAFESYRDDNWEILVMDADGSNERQLTINTEVYDFEPDWSPDSTQIAWRTGAVDGVGDIAVMTADGDDQTVLTTEPTYDREPTWSPDGTQIAFASVQTSNFDIRVMDADGASPTSLTSDSGNDYDPDWQAVTETSTLSVSKAGAGRGTVRSRPAGILCGRDCSEDFADGDVVRLRATAATGSTFTGWSGDCTGTGACVVTIDGPMDVTATFTR
jgi:Tol biopolymer transport system component